MAICTAKRAISPLKEGGEVEVSGMAQTYRGSSNDRSAGLDATNLEEYRRQGLVY